MLASSHRNNTTFKIYFSELCWQYALCTRILPWDWTQHAAQRLDCKSRHDRDHRKYLRALQLQQTRVDWGKSRPIIESHYTICIFTKRNYEMISFLQCSMVMFYKGGDSHPEHLLRMATSTQDRFRNIYIYIWLHQIYNNTPTLILKFLVSTPNRVVT